MDIQKEREAFNKEFGINNADTFPAFSGGIESSAVLKCNWLGWKKRAELECKENPETIEIEGLKTIHKLCKFADEHNMEGCTFTEIVERMFDELTKAQAVPEWISVEDKEPDCGETVLITWSDAPDVEPEKDFMDIDLDTGALYWSNYNDGDEPSHWMPLPASPKAQEKK